MTNNAHDTDRTLRRRLLERLKPFASKLEAIDPTQGIRPRGPQLFGYCCVARERLTQVTADRPRIGIVLSGEKEFWLGDNGQHFVAGDVFALPANVAFEVVNIPAEGSGLYESLLVEIERVPPELQGAVLRGRPARGLDLRLPLTPELVDALAHAAIQLSASEHAGRLAEHRLTEVLMLLTNVPAAAPLFAQSLGERINWLVLGEPSRRWTAQTLGRELGLGASTLRRKLAEQGTSLREALAGARMEVAHTMLRRGEGNITEAAAAAGYSSRSHFARRFETVYGQPPADVRSRAGMSA